MLLTILTTLAPGLAAPAVPLRAQDEAPGDAAIESALETELLLDPAIDEDRLDVSVQDGVATLGGTVGDLLAERRALRTAEVVRGVRAVVDRIELDVPPVADDVLRERIERALLRDPAADEYEIDALASDGRVTLTGTVDSWEERRLAEIAVRGVSGVSEVDNQLALDHGDPRSDAEIAADVEQSLRWDRLVDHALIGVQVADAEVRLTGAVGSAAEKRRAVRKAWTTGVRDVDATDLAVSRWARDEDLRRGKYADVSDDEIASAVRAALRVDPRVPADSVEVGVVDGQVILSGRVTDLDAQRAAIRDAELTVGVVDVRDHVKVRPADERPDEAIESDVVEALAYDPYVESYEVGVSVDDGEVQLVGRVDGWFEKARADDVAGRVRGVRNVSNLLHVSDVSYVDGFLVSPTDLHAYPWYRPEPLTTFVSDASIEEEIEDQIFWSPFVDADDVEVTVEDGVATLTGTVDSWMEWRSARENAYEGGAGHVRNLLSVGTGL